MEILRIYINVKDIIEMSSEDNSVKMILFDGYCDSKLFKGSIMNGGVDTQFISRHACETLSARYMLDGIDETGNECRIFIENNAVLNENNTSKTIPRIYTDSKTLKWLEKAELCGEIINKNGQLIISISRLN